MKNHCKAKSFIALLLVFLMAFAALPAAAVNGGGTTKADPEGEPGEPGDGCIVIEGKAPKDDEPERLLSDHGSHFINYDPTSKGEYFGDYIIIYNPDYTDSTGKSTGTLKGLIETSVLNHIDGTKEEEFTEEDLSEEDCMYCGTPEMTDRADEPIRFEDEPVGEKVSYSVGSTRNFTLSQSPISSSTVNFTCLAVGTHCYIWTPTDKTTTTLYPLDQIDSGYAGTYAAEFDSKFDLMRSSFGDHWNGSQGDGKVHLVFYNIANNNWNGFFSPNDFTNNNVPMVNIDTYPSLLTASGSINPASKQYNTIVHEYQHLIHYSICHAQNKNTESWLTEMMSAASEEICYPGSSTTGRIPNWLGYGSNSYPYSNPLFEAKNGMYYSSSGIHQLYQWESQDNFYQYASQYGLVSLYAQFLYSHMGGNSVYADILEEYANHSNYTTGSAIAAYINSHASDYSNSIVNFNRAFWIAMTMNPGEGWSEVTVAYSLFGFKPQDGYDGSNYHGVTNPYELLCPLVYTGANSGNYARTIKGGMSLVVKPVNGRFIPPSDASSGLKYIGVFTNEKLHYDTVHGEIDTYINSSVGYPFIPADGAGKSTNAGIANSSSFVIYSCFGRASSVRFRCKVSGEGSNTNVYDGLKVYLNQASSDYLQLSLATTNGQWQQYEITLPVDSNYRMVWFEYCKDGTVNSGDDCAMIDDVEFIPLTDPTLDQALNYEGGSITFTTGSDYPFYVDSYGSDLVAVSGNSHANETTSYISCRVPMFMGDKLTFEYYYDTEQNYDWFDFFVNGNSYMHVSGSGGWHEYSFTAYTEGIFTFTWQYEKDVSNHVGNDCIMIDNVRRIIDQEQTYGVDDSLNISGGSLHFTTSSSPTFWGDYWYDDSIVTASNYGSPSTTATIQTSITMYEGDALDFEYYVSSEENYDWFTFTVNGQTEMRLSGNLGWNRYYYTAPETGYYTFVWSYSKDNSVNKYMDTVKLDNIQHYKFTPSLDTALNSDATDVWMHFTSTGTYPFRVNRENVYGLYAESSNQGVNSSTSSMTSSVSLSAGDELSFYYTVNSETNYDWFEFYVNGTRTIRQSGEIGAQYYTYSVPTSGVYTFEWRYTKDSSQSVGSDTVTVTEVRIRGTGILWGDADNNGLVNANDALMVLRYSLNLITTMPNMAAADYDRNGTINTNDALMILRKAMNLI